MQNTKQTGNVKMENILSVRLENFVIKVVKIVDKLAKSFVGRHFAKQLLSSSTSAGANYEEACAAESRSDFIHKLQIALKELRESHYWLRLISRARLIVSDELIELLEEAKALSNIVGKSIVTARKNKSKRI